MDLAAALSGVTGFDEKVERFLATWFGIALPPVRDASLPPLLDRLVSVNDATGLFRDDVLLLRGEVGTDGGSRTVWFFRECQGSFRLGFLPGGPDPEVRISFGPIDGEPWGRLGAVLLHLVLDAAAKHGPSWGHGSRDAVDRVSVFEAASVLRPLHALVFPEVLDLMRGDLEQRWFVAADGFAGVGSGEGNAWLSCASLRSDGGSLAALRSVFPDLVFEDFAFEYSSMTRDGGRRGRGAQEL